jgi:putative DNA primase/helicase
VKNYQAGRKVAGLPKLKKLINPAVVDRIAEILHYREDDDEHAPHTSDEALALLFADTHADDMRFVAKWGQWLIWDGTRWKADDTLQYFNRARTICRKAARTANKGGKGVASAKTVAAIVNLARADRRLAATFDQWDRDPWLLNTPGGVVDLRNGNIRPAVPEDYLTKVTAVAPGGECPLWIEFLTWAMAGDTELVLYLQRVGGYILTGLTREHALFFLYGTGDNGKTVFLKTLADILNEYHRVAAVETFTATDHESHPAELAWLQNARLVTATETEEGRRWAESKIKKLTGGDPIAARYMRQDWFEFQPQFKLTIAGNHKPALRAVDQAIRRRINLIPFAVTVSAEQKDKDLAEKLKAEWPGILAWMIEGCRQWQERGLDPPKAVLEATREYLEAEDAIGRWLEDCSVLDPNSWESSSALFASWNNWAITNNEYVGSSKRLIGMLCDRKGFRPGLSPDRTKRGVLGLKLKPHEKPQDSVKSKFKFFVDRETEAAFLVEVGQDGRKEWLPRSQVQMQWTGEGFAEFTVPEWLVKKKNLHARGEDEEIPF